MKNLIILGAGGTGREMAEASKIAINEDYNVMGYLDDNPELLNSEIDGYQVLGTIDDYINFPEACFISSIGSPTELSMREGIYNKLDVGSDRWATIIYPNAFIAKSAKIGHGVIVYGGSQIGYGVEIGHNTLIAYGCTFGHGTSVGAGSVVASGVNCAGDIKIGERCYIGTGSAINHARNIGSDVMVSMGSTVLEDIPSHTRFLEVNRTFSLPNK